MGTIIGRGKEAVDVMEKQKVNIFSVQDTGWKALLTNQFRLLCFCIGQLVKQLFTVKSVCG